MQINEKKLENATIELTIEIPGTKVELEYKSVFDKIAQNAKIDGFRKGKAPLKLVEGKYKNQAENDVLQNLLRSTYIEAINEKQFTPIGTPVFDYKEIVRGESFTFTVKFEVPPTVEMGEYKGLDADERTCNLTDKDVEDEIQALRERNARVSKKEDDAAVQNGDLVKIQIKRIDNITPEEAEKTEFKEYTVVVGKSKDPYALDKHIGGMKVNEIREVQVDYPGDYDFKEIAGQKVTYQVKVTEISLMDLPALDDEFAKDLGSYDSLEALRTGIRDNLKGYIENLSKREVMEKLITKITENSRFDIPETMINREMEMIFRRLQERAGYHAKDINDFASVIGIDPNELYNKLKEESEKNIKSLLVRTEITKKENLTFSEERYKQVVESLASRNGKTPEEMEAYIQENRMRENIESELIIEAADEYIYKNANITKQAPQTLEEFTRSE